MARHKKKFKTGSIDAQDKKDRVSTAPNVESPVDSKNGRGYNTEDPITIGAKIKIMSLNVEGLSMAKCEYLAEQLRRLKVDILLLQETHLENKSPPSKFSINGYTVVNRQDHAKYGIITYARAPDQVIDL